MKTLLIDGSRHALTGDFNRALRDILAYGIPYHSLEWITSDTSTQRALDCLLRADRVVVVAPVYWGRLPGDVEKLLDRILLPGKVYKFHPIPLLTKWFGFRRAEGLTNIKEVYWVLSYGAPRAAMMGIPYFRLGFMISKLMLRIKKVKHIPTYLCEGGSGFYRREVTKCRLNRLVRRWYP